MESDAVPVEVTVPVINTVPVENAVPVEVVSVKDAVSLEVAEPVEDGIAVEDALPVENLVLVEDVVPPVEDSVPVEDAIPVPKVNIRHEWYQTEATVVVTILARNIEEIFVDYTDKTLTVELSVPSQDFYRLNLNLAHKIVPEKSSYRVMSTKVEVKLFKLDGLQWNTLEEDASHELLTGPSKSDLKCTGPPRYPSSHKVQRDWNAIEKNIIRELAAIEQPKGAEGVNTLFQQIYGDGSDEVKRAMNKSFLESGGTVLSTNWNEISKDKVQIKPPDGMEWKKWD
ncbi:suppressor-of-G2-allele-of-skp1 [Carabus blaptoides fortunei]